MTFKHFTRFVNQNIFQKLFGLSVIGVGELERLRSFENIASKAEIPFFEYDRLKSIDSNLASNGFSIELYKKVKGLVQLSKSQLWQDLFVLYFSGFKRGGFFVEFGATNGLTLSNTYLLEKNFGWHGILAEPAKGWRDDLRKNRNATIFDQCVWKKSGAHLEFVEANVGEVSTLEAYKSNDEHYELRKYNETYVVETISLMDLLIMGKSPKIIDYISIDTEGSEYDILAAFDFTAYTFNIITCEHNNTGNKAKIYDLLSTNGYTRVYEHLTVFEDWYIHNSYLKTLKS